MLQAPRIFLLHGWLLLLGLLCCATQTLRADGKIYAPEEVPTEIPYQRAAILFDQGKQTLILQSQYRIPSETNEAALGWVVPLPAVPEIAATDASAAESGFMILDSMTQPRISDYSEIILNWLFLILFFIWIAVLVLAPILWLCRLGSEKGGLARFSKRILKPWPIIIFVFGVGGALFFLLVEARAWKGVTGVEVIKSQQAGIHGVQIIKADSVEPLMEWLEQEGFHHEEADRSAFEGYIQRGWCFAASKVDHDIRAENHKAVSQGLLAPLVLRFPVEHPVYPTALTATAGHETEILIYLASNTPLSNQSPLKLKFHGKRPSPGSFPVWFSIEPSEFIHDGAYRFTYLSKFKGTVSPQQMSKDFEFPPGPEMPDYREHIKEW